MASAFQTGEHAGICPWPALVHDPGGPPKAPPGSFAPFLQLPELRNGTNPEMRLMSWRRALRINLGIRSGVKHLTA